MRPLRPLFSTSVALLVAITPALTSAFTTFPGYIETHLALTYKPPCTICHLTDAGGPPATLTHPFGQAMLQTGLTPTSSEAQVDEALDELKNAKTDSDCNTIIDITQLEDGRDPNPPGEYIDGSNRPTKEDEPDGGCADQLQPVLYGCGAQLSPAEPSGAGSAAFVAALVTAVGLALWRPRHRARPVRSRLSGR